MVLKRDLSDDSSEPEVPNRESKRQQKNFPKVVGQALKGFTPHEFKLVLEPLLRRVVREEVECAILRFLNSSPRASLNSAESSGVRSWHLQFDNQIPDVLFTGSRIVSVDSEPLKIHIVDATTKKIISSGPLSSIKIEIVVVDGDFGTDLQEDWTERDFNSRLLRQREGKGPLLTGDRLVTLKDGVGYVGEISFTDNSSWIRSRKFSLGAKIVTSTPELKVKEARTMAFIVKDQRGESYRKHHPPYSGDEIWRLVKIAKDGTYHKNLAINGISTVKNFLHLYATDPFGLRRAFGGKVSNKSWDIIIRHATECIPDDDKLYCYWARESVGLVFNSIYRVVGVTFDGHNFLSLDKLTVPQMKLVEGLKQHAYKNLNSWVQVDEQSTVGISRPWADLPAGSFSNASLDLQQGNFPVENQEFGSDESEMQQSFDHISTQPSTFEVDDSSQFEFSSAPNLTAESFDGVNSWSTSGPILAVDDGPYRIDTSTWLPNSPMWGSGDGFYSTPTNEFGMLSSYPGFSIHFSGNGKPKAGWCKLRAAVKWGMLVRRSVAAKRMQSLCTV